MLASLSFLCTIDTKTSWDLIQRQDLKERLVGFFLLSLYKQSFLKKIKIKIKIQSLVWYMRKKLVAFFSQVLTVYFFKSNCSEQTVFIYCVYRIIYDCMRGQAIHGVNACVCSTFHDSSPNEYKFLIFIMAFYIPYTLSTNINSFGGNRMTSLLVRPYKNIGCNAMTWKSTGV